MRKHRQGQALVSIDPFLSAFKRALQPPFGNCLLPPASGVALLFLFLLLLLLRISRTISISVIIATTTLYPSYRDLGSPSYAIVPHDSWPGSCSTSRSARGFSVNRITPKPEPISLTRQPHHRHRSFAEPARRPPNQQADAGLLGVMSNARAEKTKSYDVVVPNIVKRESSPSRLV